MTDAELLFNYVSGKRKLTITEQLTLAGKGLLRYRTDDTVTVKTLLGEKAVRMPRRRFRPVGSKPTGGEILSAIDVGAVPLNRELSAELSSIGVTEEQSVNSTIELTSLGRTVMLREIPVREIRNIYGSEFIIR